MSASMRWAAIPAMLLPIALGPGAVQNEPVRPAAPLEPVAALLDAFESHDVVALGDPHGDVRAHAFRLSLIRDARLVPAVDDIVVEWGNALYQDVMDEYVNGADVALEELRPVWRNTTQRRVGQPPVDPPFVEEFFRTVREVNLSRVPERRLRVLLGDPPIDWADIETLSDLQPWIDLRDIHPAELIRREVLARRRRALVIYGGMHLQRHNLFGNYELMADRRVHTLVQQLEAMRASVFTAHPAHGRPVRRRAASRASSAVARVTGRGSERRSRLRTIEQRVLARAVVALGAGLVPAQRASRIEPMAALRHR